MSRDVFVNGAFRPQRISGQQRYAVEIAIRTVEAGAREVRPGKFWSGSKLRTWLWTQTVLPARTWNGVLVSMTARAPLWHPRHVLVVHDLFAIEHPEWFSRLYHLTHAPLQWFQLRTARALVAVSEPVAEQVRAIGVRSTVVVAPNAPSAAFDPASGTSNAALEARGLTPSAYLVTVGNIEPRKNLSRLAAAWAQIPEHIRTACPLVVVGGSADVFRGSDIAWPEAGVVIAGYVTDDELRALYRGARAVVFPSLAEGFGLPIVEAIRAGSTRLALSDLDVFRWICGDAARYFDPLDVDSIEGALLEVSTGLATPTAPDIASRFDWHVSARAIMSTALSAR